MFPSLDDFVAGAAKNSAGAEPSNNALETPKRTTKKKKQHDMCHQAVIPAPATPPQFQGPNLTNQPVAVVYTGKKMSRSVAKAGDSNRDNDVVSTKLTTANDEISPIGNEGADDSVVTSSPTNLEHILGMENENIPPFRSSKGTSSKIGKPPKTSRRDNKSSKNNNKKKRQGAASSKLADVEDAKDRGSLKDEDDVEVKQDGVTTTNIDLGQEKEELASINPMKIVILHMVVALVCGTCASMMWVENNVPPRNVSIPTDEIINESEAVAIEQEVQRATPAFNKRSVEHFVLRKEIRTIGARSKRWMKSAHACRENLEITQADFEEASLTMMEMIDENKKHAECDPTESISDDAIVNVVVPADLPQSTHAHVSSPKVRLKGHARMHILSAMGRAALTSLASKVLVDGSVKVASSATSSPLASVVGALRGASISSLASRVLVEGTAKVAAGTTVRSFAMTRVIGAATGSPFALVMSVGMVAIVIASVHAAGNDNGESIDV